MANTVKKAGKANIVIFTPFGNILHRYHYTGLQLYITINAIINRYL